MLGKLLVVGITYLDDDEGVDEQVQFAGTVLAVEPLVSIDRGEGLDPFTLPPEEDAFEPAPPGEYRLRATGAVVVDPDFMTTWTVHKPAPGEGRRSKTTRVPVAESLQEVEEKLKKPLRRGWRGLVYGPGSGLRIFVVQAPQGQLEITREGGRVTVQGRHIPTAVVEAGPVVSIPVMQRGIEGRVGSDPVRIIRPRYGFRRRSRSVLIDGGGIEWRTEYRRSRIYDIVRRADGSVVYRRTGAKQFLDADASGAEVTLALAVAASGVIESSSLVNYLTL